MKPDPEAIELDYEELHSKLNQIEQLMGPAFAQPFRQLLEWYVTLLSILRDKTISIQRLKTILFGSSTERTSAVLSNASESSESTEDATGEQTETAGTGNSSELTTSQAATDGTDLGEASEGESNRKGTS
jgi:hypothetical protein